MSALHFTEATTLTCFLKRSPSRCSWLRSRVSEVVSRDRLACITRRTAGDEARGALARIDFTHRVWPLPHQPAWDPWRRRLAQVSFAGCGVIRFLTQYGLPVPRKRRA